jgi:MoaA/NifB/PqqE/SkfB family radical SAM enzyme
VSFAGLTALCIQITGTSCNLRCSHCLNASGPRDPWLKPLDASVVERAIADAEAYGVREIYFTGGEPFLHPAILRLVERALAVAATTVLTNGTLITPAIADALADLVERSRYSLEIRVSVDDPEAESNDAVRGKGSFARATRGIRLLHARGLLPILTSAEIRPGSWSDRFARFSTMLRGLGVDRPRIKLLPLFPIGRARTESEERLTNELLEGFDRTTLQCAGARVVADGGIYACPILAGVPEARMSGAALGDAFGPVSLDHKACVTCWRSGATCRND